MLDRFLRALGVADEALPTSLDEQVSLYRSLLAGKHVLVVLDNVSSADQVRPLLPASPMCLALVTSRDRLAGLVARDGAQLLNLDVLAPEEAVELLARMIGHDRVADEPQEAAELAHLCGYLPLAVRIAAANLATRPGMNVASLVGRLAEERSRLGELAAGDVEVRASFALSHEGLDLDRARMFRRLGLIAGPDFASGVAAVLTDTAPKDAERLLEALVDAHLLEPADIPDRYRFHDLLRLYARERVQADEADRDWNAALRRMLDWYLDTASAAYRLLGPTRRLPLQGDRASCGPEPVFATRAEALSWLEVERASLVAATHQAADHGLYPIAWQLPAALGSFFHLRKYWVDWQDTHHVALAAAQQAQHRHAEAWLLTTLGIIRRQLRCSPEAIDYFQRSLTISREVRDRHGESRTLRSLGVAHVDLRRFDDAKEYYQQALAINREIGEPSRQAETLNDLGTVYRHLGRFEEAIDQCHQALAIRREIGDRYGEGWALNSLGLALWRTEGIEAARACWRDALVIFTELAAPKADEVRARLERDESTAR